METYPEKERNHGNKIRHVFFHTKTMGNKSNCGQQTSLLMQLLFQVLYLPSIWNNPWLCREGFSQPKWSKMGGYRIKNSGDERLYKEIIYIYNIYITNMVLYGIPYVIIYLLWHLYAMAIIMVHIWDQMGSSPVRWPTDGQTWRSSMPCSPSFGGPGDHFS